MAKMIRYDIKFYDKGVEKETVRLLSYSQMYTLCKALERCHIGHHVRTYEWREGAWGDVSAAEA